MRLTMNKFNKKKFKRFYPLSFVSLLEILHFPWSRCKGLLAAISLGETIGGAGLANLSQQLEVIAASDMEQHYCQVDGWVGLKLN